MLIEIAAPSDSVGSSEWLAMTVLLLIEIRSGVVILFPARYNAEMKAFFRRIRVSEQV
jgi:hypothetical protein